MIREEKGNILLKNGYIYDPIKDRQLVGDILVRYGTIREVGKCKPFKKFKFTNEFKFGNFHETLNK